MSVWRVCLRDRVYEHDEYGSAALQSSSHFESCEVTSSTPSLLLSDLTIHAVVNLNTI